MNNIQMEEYQGPLIPLQSIPSDIEAQLAGIVRNVTWHFAGQAHTYVADFDVVDTDRFDVLISQFTLNTYQFLPRVSTPRTEPRDLDSTA
ncbi:hypothetical protein ASPZODRAFT_135991 [Penicilliopsis zonata CBS 506.65]|uniref:Uncharacterized protein n=1 Tax=Penicilliopsis zonata CBS 506.65 TaxID=1073090 RepID=A0A1L9S8R1_9EURO|nr:hypothetical protein ASPZODRAFT_135991 [Penicilliopsis zonata CBS 506.65]OJJ43534.1 hypothetical protein ASPZODRAFT_135991 [Penicilliopsis zonata CBS 506.65]